MSKPRVSEVLIHVLGGAGSGRTSFKRRFLLDIFHNAYDPTCMVGPDRKLIGIAGAKVVVGLETLTMGLYRHESEIDRCIRPADAMIVIMTPTRPGAMDETERLRFKVVDKAIKANGELLERVVIMKDTDVSWGVDAPGHSRPVIKPDNIDDDERSRREEEWKKDAERGYQLAKRLGAEVAIACPRTGEGVEEAVHELVLEVLEGREALAEKTKRLEEERHREEEKRVKDREKRARSYTARLRKLIGRGDRASEK